MNTMLINLSLFKAGWLAAVFSAAASLPGVGTAVIGIAALVHIVLSDRPQDELRLLALAAAIGFAWESSLVASGLVSYEAGMILPGFAPYWIVAMWVLFATTINIGMRWLRKSTTIAVLTGAIGGPLSFLAGEKAGAVTFSDPQTALLVIGIGWALFLPLLVRYAVRNDARAVPVAS
ncbi:MAG: DUF2878 domain-containing protein [Gammaproteobacteria bacterium]|jgi:hypothetical protein|nr:DUF2878 domain-containing protein [Gammaproteobacteria bacterium]